MPTNTVVPFKYHGREPVGPQGLALDTDSKDDFDAPVVDNKARFQGVHEVVVIRSGRRYRAAFGWTG